MRAAIWTVVVLTLLVGGAVVADGVARARTEEQFAVELTESLSGVDGTPDVTIGGFPFLTQLARGRLTSVRITAPVATVDDLRLEDVVVDLVGVETSQPYAAEQGTMTALVRTSAIAAVLPVPLDLSMRDGQLAASMSVLGLPLDVLFEARPAGRDVVVDVTGFVLAGAEVGANELPASITELLQGMMFGVPGLPAGMELTAVAAGDDGLVLTAEGRDLTLDWG